MTRRAALAALPFIVCCTVVVSGATDRPGNPGTRVAAAREHADARRYDAAVVAAAEGLAEAVALGDCRAAADAVEAARDAAFFAADRIPLFEAAASLRRAFPARPACFDAALTAWVQVLGRLGYPDAAAAAARTAAGSLPGGEASGESARRWRRIAALSAGGGGRLPSKRVRTTLRDPFDPLWVGAPARIAQTADDVVEGARHWSGAEDAAFEMRACHMLRTVFLRAWIRDDDLRPEARDPDVLVISFGLREGAAPLHRRSPERANGETLVVRVPLTAAETRRPVEDVARAWRLCVAGDGGYRVMVCIPQDSVPGLHFEPGSSFAFDAAFRDRDSVGTTVVKLWGMEADPEAMFLSGILTTPDEEILPADAMPRRPR